MSELNLWRGIALFACLGWAGTALSTLGGTPAAKPASTLASAERSRPPQRDVRRVRIPEQHHEPPMRRPTMPDRAAEVPDLHALKAAIRSEVEAEIETERRQRHEARRERFLSRQLDEVAAFAEEYDLDDGVQGDLEAAVLAMHDRMEALGPPPGPPGPPGSSGPPPEVRESFAQLDADVRAVLDDETADAFHEWTRPGPPRP